jgi:hypothetical protein
LSGTRPLQVNETTYRGYKMVAGLVSSRVEDVYLTGPNGRAVRIPIRGQTFFIGGQRLGVIEARAGGKVIGTYELGL